MATVTLSAVRKTYPNGFKAIHGIDLAIHDGEFLVLVGPSGCGKSTLLRMIAGLESITDGEIRIADNVVNRLEPARRDIAMVFQNYALYPHMSVFDNMAYGLRNRGTPRAEIDKRVRAAARTLELEPLLERKPRQLSGGQRQRVAMGRAIVREPAVFLFDEPLSNLDAKLRVQMRLEIRRLQRRLGTTSIYVTHDQVEAMTMADRIVVMNNGIAEQVGAPLELYRRPATRFVAGFIGSPGMNFLDARLADGALEVPGLDTAWRLPLPRGLSGAAEGPVTLGIRPEDLRPAAMGETGTAFHVESVEPLGADTLVHGHRGREDEWLTLRLDAQQVVQPGDTLPVSVAADALHLFDATDGHRLDGVDAREAA